jgi:predicted metal-dependent hydrolase
MRPDGSPLIVQLAGRAIEVWPRISPRSLRLRLAVRPGPKVVLSYPPQASESSARAFLEANLSWLEKVLAKARPVQSSLLDHLRKYPWVTLDERLMEVRLGEGARTSLKLVPAEDQVDLTLAAAAPEVGAARALRRLAETGLPLAVERLSRRVGVSVAQVGVRDQTTRWGSCSAGGSLSLNWRLVLLPPLLHDHVILHELSHRRHMDHSDRFWNQLAAWDPQWRKHDRELTKRWNVIMDLGRV